MVSSGVWQVYPPDRDMHLKREGQRDEPLICLIFCGQLGMLQMDHHWGPQKCIQLHSSRSSRSQVAYDHQQQQQQQNRFKIPPAFPPCACLLLSTQCKCQKCTMVRIVPSFEINIFLSINEIRAENPGPEPEISTLSWSDYQEDLKSIS